jgi:hypothetical protein
MKVSENFPNEQERSRPDQACYSPAVPTALDASAERALKKLLQRMNDQGLSARNDPLDPECVILVKAAEARVGEAAKASLSAGRAPRALIEEALRRGLMRVGGRGSFRIEPRAAATGGGGLQAQNPASTMRDPPPVRDAEDPLLRLHRRKTAAGEAWLDDASFLAGERFRRDVTQAAMLPSVTSDWSRLEASASRATPRDPALASDVVVAARQRVREAYRALGPDMGNFVLDICGFLAPLQEAEARRSWPARSGKLVLRLALSRLADHYGIEGQARGGSGGQIAGWIGGDGRSGMEAWLAAP